MKIKSLVQSISCLAACSVVPFSQAAVLEEVIVTAQKKAESLQDVPVTVATYSGEDMEDFGVDDLFEMANMVQGMVFSRAPDDGLALTLRGLGTPARTQSFDQSVALFLDGMFLGKGRLYSGGIFDVERLEVIKGTQSTLLGKNTSLGAISVITRKPGQELAGNVSVGAEIENGGVSVDGGIDVPVTDSFSIRVAGHYLDQDGAVKNIVTGNDVPADEEKALRVTANWDVTDQLNAVLSVQTSDSERTGNGFQFVDNAGVWDDDALALFGEATLDDTKSAICPECPSGESFHDTESDLVNLTINYDMENVTLTSVTSYAAYDLSFYDDFDFGDVFDEVTYLILDPGTVDRYSTYFTRVEDYSQFSQELRFDTSVGDNLEVLGGLFYFKSEWDSTETQYFNTPNFPPVGPTGQIFNGSFANNFAQDTETVSTFAQLTYSFTDRFRGVLGLRYTDEQKDVVFERVQGDTATLWNSVINPPFDAPLEFSDDFLNGNANLQFDLNDDIMLYASYGLGSKTGGFAESAEVGSANPALSVAENGAMVETEEATTFELGTKMTLLDGAANLNIALFRTDVDDFQETSFLVTDAGAAFLTRNIDVDSEGIELDGQWQITDSFRLMGGVTYADSTNAGDGSTLAQAPLWTGNMGYFYERALGDSLMFSNTGFVRYRDEMVSQINETFPSDDLTTVDLSFSLSDVSDSWSVSLIATNIFDEVSADFNGPPAGPVGAIFGAPTGDQGITSESPSALRSVTLKLGYNF
jgi:iron complex outermembrane receptor protein